MVYFGGEGCVVLAHQPVERGLFGAAALVVRRSCSRFAQAGCPHGGICRVFEWLVLYTAVYLRGLGARRATVLAFLAFPAHEESSAEDMENNMRYVRESRTLHEGAQALVARSVEMAALMVGRQFKSPAVKAQT